MPALQGENGILKVSLFDIEGGAQSKLAPTRPTRNRIIVTNSYPLIVGATPQLILGHTPKRKRAVIVINGSGMVAFGTSQSECQAAQSVGTGEQIGGVAYVNGAELLSDIKLYGNTELWAAAITSLDPTQPVITPATPATGNAIQNPFPYPVQVVIGANGATITNVSVNGITVGVAAGTYYIPAYGALSIAYTVAIPTMVWTNATFSIPTVVSVLKENEQ
jgi:hypothetical protein